MRCRKKSAIFAYNNEKLLRNASIAICKSFKRSGEDTSARPHFKAPPTSCAPHPVLTNHVVIRNTSDKSPKAGPTPGAK